MVKTCPSLLKSCVKLIENSLVSSISDSFSNLSENLDIALKFWLTLLVLFVKPSLFLNTYEPTTLVLSEIKYSIPVFK